MTVQIGDRDDWRIDFARYGGPFIVECGLTDANPNVADTIAKIMASYDINGQHRDFETTQRRAYLIAAAPTMFAALQAVEEWWLTTQMHKENGAPHAIFAARAAIAKASPLRGG